MINTFFDNSNICAFKKDCFVLSLIIILPLSIFKEQRSGTGIMTGMIL
jgi:hypothetical protein